MAITHSTDHFDIPTFCMRFYCSVVVIFIKRYDNSFCSVRIVNIDNGDFSCISAFNICRCLQSFDSSYNLSILSNTAL